MGLSSFPEGVLPLLVMNAVASVSILKSVLRSLLQSIAGGGGSSNDEGLGGGRRVSIRRYGCVVGRNDDGGYCCVCLSGFEPDEEVSRLPCKHFFHKGCLETWLHKHHRTTCPLCRSIF